MCIYIYTYPHRCIYTHTHKHTLSCHKTSKFSIPNYTSSNIIYKILIMLSHHLFVLVGGGRGAVVGRFRHRSRTRTPATTATKITPPTNTQSISSTHPYHPPTLPGAHRPERTFACKLTLTHKHTHTPTHTSRHARAGHWGNEGGDSRRRGTSGDATAFIRFIGRKGERNYVRVREGVCVRARETRLCSIDIWRVCVCVCV